MNVAKIIASTSMVLGLACSTGADSALVPVGLSASTLDLSEPCEPLTTRCNAGAVYLCQIGGFLELIEVCSDAGQLCEGGQCVSLQAPPADALLFSNPADNPGSEDAKSTATDTIDDAKTTEITQPCEWVSVIDHEKWEALELDDDPYWDGDPKPVSCTPEEYLVEIGITTPVFSVNTTGCAWITVRQTLTQAIPKDTPMEINVVRFPVDVGDGPYSLTLAVGTPPETIWDASVPIPQLKGGYETGTWNTDSAISPGDTLWFHLENHDPNEWWIDRIRACL